MMTTEIPEPNYQAITSIDEEAQTAYLLHQNYLQNKTKRYLLYGLILSILVIIVLSLFTIYYAKNNDDKASSSISSPICSTAACYNLATDIRQSINASVDPCDNFFHFACDGWRSHHNWELSKESQLGTLNTLNIKQKQVFMNVITDSSHPLQQQQSVLKSKTFFDSCYTSDINEEDIESESLLKEFMNMVNFSDFNLNTMNITDINAQSWDDISSVGFHESMVWMLQRSWDDLFSLYAFDVGTLWIEQKWNIWMDYDVNQWKHKMNETFIALYQSLFGLNLKQAQFIGDLVIEFTQNIANITTADDTYKDTDLRNLYIQNTSFDQVNILFGSNDDVLNYEELMRDTFECINGECVDSIIYLKPDIQFFIDLVLLINDTSPYIIQYWFFTDILDNYFNYGHNKDSFQQSRFDDRRDYCFVQTRNNFPYVYGYIIAEETYSVQKYDAALDTTERVLRDGVTALMHDVDWMDQYSLDASLHKAEHMDLYVGLPPNMTNIQVLDAFYDIDTLSLDNGYIKNYDLVLEFIINNNLKLFRGDEITLHHPWPSFFASQQSTGIWLTGVNAFYFPIKVGQEKGNWFCMPQTITQQPMFDLDYPMLVNYAAWGTVVGHEITHGFDSSGSTFDYEGEDVEMWSNETRQRYNEKIQCFVDQYNQIEVEPGIFVNGDQTKTENTADNGGMAAARAAYAQWKKDVNLKIDPNRAYLPGLDYTEEQLWWITYGKVWCNVFRDGFYSSQNYSGVHGPSVARVNGVVQNFHEFAQAFNCAVGSEMNPANKCGLWH